MEFIKKCVNMGINGITVLFMFLYSLLLIPLQFFGFGSSNKLKKAAHNPYKPINKNDDNKWKKNNNTKPTKRKTFKKVGNIYRLSHEETDDKNNRLDNGNSTMFGGDNN